MNSIFSDVVVDSRIIEALWIITKHLKRANINWTVVGSVSLALQGIDIEPNDIDILTDEHGAFQIGLLLKEYEVKPVRFRADIFESFYGLYDIQGTKVEIIGDLRVKIDGILVSLSDKIKPPKLIQIDSMTIPVSSLHDQLFFYEKLGREKDTERIYKIREALNM